MPDLVALKRLKWATVDDPDRVIEVGHPVPDDDPHRNYDAMLNHGLIAFANAVPPGFVMHRPPVKAPGDQEKDGMEAAPIPANLAEHTKEQLFEIAERLGITEIEGTGADGNVLKADLIKAIEAERLTPAEA